ncbi:ABC transporter substrate-binding protein [Acuticoccus kandeliae]|uniref:ABC transporter substrate-binding protein n=1 Tax=Acuticoccus kandeliae TaxID=2073160 RepID=UPI000D3EBD18|nr:ABC transporter substrate-binding protein [Acuticoccus kandeliae]
MRLMLGVAATALLIASSAFAQDEGLTDSTILIGTFTPTTGPAANFGKVVSGVEAVYKAVNDEGGINGRKIEIIREDTACDPTRGVAAVKKLISQDRVFMLHGGTCSNVVMAAKPEIVRSGIPFVVAGAANSHIGTPTEANIFQPVATTATVARTMVDFAMSKPDASKIAIISHSDDWGKSNRDPAVEYLKSKYNLDPALDLFMERGSTDTTPQVLRLRQANPDVILAMLYPAEVAIFMRDMYKYGLRVPTLGTQAISIEDTKNRVGNPAAVENFYVFYPVAAPIDSPTMKPYYDMVAKYFPNERPETLSFLGMGGAYAVVEALKNAGPDLTREKFVAAMNAIHDLDTGVASAPIGFTPEDHVGIKGGAMVTYVDGEAMVVHELTPQD